MLVPVIICGGVGSRLWPLSREQYPKQFHHLGLDDLSLFQYTIQRVQQIADVSRAIVICNEEHRFLVAEQLRLLPGCSIKILLEPVPRNTAPAVAAAALEALALHEEDPILWVLPADHSIRNTAALSDAVNSAVSLARQSMLVTFGVPATEPQTGYGYIRRGGALGESAFSIDAFVEKPDEETARKYVDDGGYLWNSGMFLFRAKTYLDELACHAPNINRDVQLAHKAAVTDLDFLRLESEAFNRCESNSIDYAVMEATQRGAVVALNADWSDVGSWSGLWALTEKDAAGNAVIGDVLVSDSYRSMIYSDSRLVVTLGVSDLIVVETADAVLVADKTQSQALKGLVEELGELGRPELSAHRRVYRPWGWYETVCSGDRFQVKRIEVLPGQKLSLQTHQFRAEHWVVVKGEGRVTCNDNVMILNEDQSTYIPQGYRHRLENLSEEPLQIIEVQTGIYLGEDDIVRYADDYGR